MKCNAKIHKDVLNNTVINDFSNRWGREIKHYSQQLKQEMKLWKKACQKKVDSLESELKQLRVKASIVRPAEQHYETVIEIIENQLKELEKERITYIQTQKRIKHLLNEPMTLHLLNRFKEDISAYSKNEQRSILSLAIKSIFYDFERNEFEINYRLTPYVEIEALLEIITHTKKLLYKVYSSFYLGYMIKYITEII